MKAIEIRVTYNGLTKTVELQPQMQVVAAVQQAAHRFSITNNVHLLALFREDGSEIQDNQSVADAGITSNDLLALRPSTVKGG